MAGPSTYIEASTEQLLYSRLVCDGADLSFGVKEKVLLKDYFPNALYLATTTGILKRDIVNLLASGQPLDHGMIAFGDPLTGIIKKNKYGYTNV